MIIKIFRKFFLSQQINEIKIKADLSLVMKNKPPLKHKLQIIQSNLRPLNQTVLGLQKFKILKAIR